MTTQRASRSPLAAVPARPKIASLDLRSALLPTACQQCGAEVERYDARGRAWCAMHFSGSIRFSVASYHWAEREWLASPNAFTMMAIPPKGWPKERNVDLFTPPWKLVKGHREGKISDAEYTQQFSKQMQESLPQIKAWVRLHSRPFHHITLLCTCPGYNIDERFCHRYLVAKLLVWLGCSEEPWVAPAKQERQAAA